MIAIIDNMAIGIRFMIAIIANIAIVIAIIGNKANYDRNSGQLGLPQLPT